MSRKMRFNLMAVCAILALVFVIGCGDAGADSSTETNTSDFNAEDGLLACYPLTNDCKDTVSGVAAILSNLDQDNVLLKEYASGKKALFFNGTSDWFCPCGSPHDLGVTNLATFTLSAWIKVYDELFTSGGAIFGSGGIGNDDIGAMLLLLCDENGKKSLGLDVGWEIWSPQVGSENGGDYGRAFAPIPDSVDWTKWHHAAVTYNHATCVATFYFDGALIGTDKYLKENISDDEIDAFVAPNFAQSGALMRVPAGDQIDYWLEHGAKLDDYGNILATIVIGATQNWGPIGFIFEGYIRDCRLYNKVLDAGQISALKKLVTP